MIVRDRAWPGWWALAAAVVLGALLVALPLELAVLVIGGTAVGLLILIQPLVGLALTLIAGPFGALEQVILGSSGLDSGQILLFVTFAAWILRGMVRRKIVLPANGLTMPFILLIATAMVSLIGAPSVELGVRELLKWLEMWLIVLLVLDLATEDWEGQDSSLFGGPAKTGWILAMLLIAGLSQALIGIWQFALRGDGPEHFLVLERFYRAYGTFEQPNPFGGFMNLTALLAIGVLLGMVSFKLRGSGGEKRVAGGQWLVVTAFVALVAGVTTMALLFSWSRGAWLGFAAGLAVMAFFWPRRRMIGFLLLAAGLLLIGVVTVTGRMPAAVTDRLTGFAEDFRFGDVRGVDINDENYSVLERQAHWQAGLDMLRDDVWLGVGFGNYAAAYEDYALINWPDALGHAHNYYINLLAEVGTAGLLAYLFFWLVVFWQTIRLLGALDWPARGIGLGLIAVWTALAAHHLVDKLYVNNIYIHLGVLLGLLQLMRLQSENRGLSGRNQLDDPVIRE